MAAPGMSHGKRKGHRSTQERHQERHLDQNWRQPLRSGSPGTSHVNGNSPYASLKRDSNASPADLEFKKNVDFLQREWRKCEAELKSRKDTITQYVDRNPDKPDWPGVDLDAFLESVHHLQQQQQLQ
ncbi:uncharacterized protein LOC111337160 [Stylophora pistillata]|uniref:Uncharacterized protein n=1 Tax=Stylophora pistillata TaxID=50429 RepID=A0A2B4RUI5_STYPI|nr:uncharacterized protein LOC111337160 [Stylophora pistillata]PFX20220.1 hypothetical protein AWC38_SpisGene15363 [Stylophora pistillata]